jgi:PAS domain S-box-containing protein
VALEVFMPRKASGGGSGSGKDPQGTDKAAPADARILIRLEELGSRLWHTRNLQEGLEAALGATVKLLGADGGIVRLLDPERSVLRVAVHHNFDGRTLATYDEIPADSDTDSGMVLKAGHRVIIDDVDSGSDFGPFRELARASGFRSIQATPLIGREGDPLGMLATHRHKLHRLDTVECATLDLCARQICNFIERCRADEALRAGDQAAHRLAAIVESSDDAIVSKNLDGIITSWNAGAERLFGYAAEEAIGQSITMVIPPDRLEEEPRILERIRRGENVRHFETVRMRKDGSLVDISLTVSPVRDRRGRIVGASKIARDISERRAAENHRDLLVAELSHRVKNTLATVTSIARHSFHNKASVEVARTSFERRLQALAENHTRLAVTGWSGVAMKEIFEDELAPYRSGDNIAISGPDVVLKAQCALALGMAAHELATNAAKYGALSAEGGRVGVEWSVDRECDALLVRWTERGGPPTETPKTQGFGRLMLERALAAELDGEVVMDFAPAGLTCTIRIPLDACIFDTKGGGDGQRPGPDRGLPRPAAAVPAGRQARSRILVVEDEFLLASVLTNDLAAAGYSVVGPLMSLRPARAASRNERIDLAVLDVNLGEETVYPLADELMQRKMPFVLLTSVNRHDLPPRFRHLPFLTKPYKAPDLLRKIEQLIAHGGVPRQMSDAGIR